jgi:hypothetical protein
MDFKASRYLHGQLQASKDILCMASPFIQTLVESVDASTVPVSA